jgi:vitamin B12 transporter
VFLKLFSTTGAHFIFLIIIGSCGNTFAQTENDSVRHTTAPPITVSTDAEYPEILIHPTDIQSATAKELTAQSGAIRLSNALEIIHPSLDIRSYGALGGVAFASFRGLPAEYTSIYWEGIKITNSQNSLSDLALIDLASVQSVGVISAANAQLIGGDIGGAGILLRTNANDITSGINIGTIATSYDDIASIDEKELHLSAASKITDDLKIAGGFSTAGSKGDYPFSQQVSDNSTQLVRRENNDAKLLNANLAADYRLDEHATLKAFSIFTKAERGAPGAATIEGRGASDLTARQSDEDFLSALSLHHQPLQNFDYTISLGYQSQYETYDIPSFNVADKYLNRIYSFIWKSKTILSDWADLFGGVDYTKNQLLSNENSLSKTDTTISRESYAAYLAIKAKLLENFDAAFSMRTELLSDINRAQILPGFSLHYSEPSTSLQLQASYGKIYHAPTFNELYWRVGGNIHLHAEDGNTMEISAGIPIQFSSDVKSNVLITGYRTQMEDQIIWLPTTNNSIWSPSNVKSSRSEGIEFTAELQYVFAENYLLTIREQFMRGHTINLSNDSNFYGKELPYSTPLRSLFSIGLENNSIGSLWFSGLYRWHRFTDFYNNESTKLPAVAIFDLTFTSRPIDLAHVVLATLRLNVANLTNRQYAEIPGYPLPGRSISFSIDFHFFNQ